MSKQHQKKQSNEVDVTNWSPSFSPLFTLSQPGSPKDDNINFITPSIQPTSNNNNNNTTNNNQTFQSVIPIAPPNPTLQVVSFAPDVGPANSNTKILLVLNQNEEGGKNEEEPKKKYVYSAIFEGIETPASFVAPGIIEFYSPRHSSGIVYFWISKREFDARETTYSNTLPFYYYPSDDIGRVSLANHNFSDEHQNMILKFRHTVKELDLSGNCLRNIDFLSGFYNLNTLIVDSNHITHTSKFPVLTKLTGLYINCNQINELENFIDNLAEKMPNLQYLSMLGNIACPIFGEVHHYYNYRIFIISKLRRLVHLDSSPVTEEEFRHASCIIEHRTK